MRPIPRRSPSSSLLGDPSLRPFPGPVVAASATMLRKRGAKAAVARGAADAQHKARRKSLKAAGQVIAAEAPRARRVGPLRKAMPSILRADDSAIRVATTLRFRVDSPADKPVAKAMHRTHGVAFAARTPAPRIDEVRVEFLPTPQPTEPFAGSLRPSPLRVVRAQVTRLARGEVISRRSIWSK
jgi:hypothetical protein